MNEPPLSLDLDPKAAWNCSAAFESFRTHVDRFGSFVARLEAVQLQSERAPTPEPSR